MLPWVSLYNEADGTVLPCCHWMGPAMGSLRRSPPEELLNSQAVRRLRRDMLAGKPSSGCSYCYDSELTGGFSARKWANHRFAADQDLVESTREDGSLPKIRVRRLHVIFSNLCNFRCRMCSIERSSSWYEDALLIGDLKAGRFKHALWTPTDDLAGFLRILERRLPEVQVIQMVGGEPLLAAGHYRLLELLLERKLNHITLQYNTNFSTLTFRGKDVTCLWNQFKDVEVAASFDAMGRRGEYLRKGQDWGESVRNWRRARRECPRVKFSVAPVASLFNALHLPDFHREWIERGLIEPARFGLQILRSPSYYSMQALPPELKARVAERFMRHAKDYLRPLAAGRQPKDYLPSSLNFMMALNYMMAADRSSELATFRRVTAQLDGARGESFEAAFPELACLLDE